MHGTHQAIWRNGLLHTWRAYVVIISLISTLSSCQTLQFTEKPGKDEKIKDLIETKISLIKDLLDKGQAEEAWETVRPMLQAHPDSVPTLNIGGLTHLALSNHDRALALFRRAYEIARTPAIGLNLSSALIAAGKLSTARRVIQKLLTHPEPYAFKERLWHNLALTYDKEQRVALAEKYYLKALRENPSYYLSNLQLAHLYKRQEKMRLAMTYYKKAAHNCKSCLAPRSELVTYLLNAGQYNRAITLLGRFIKNKQSPAPEVKEAHHLLDLAQSVKAKRTRRLQ